MPHGAGALEEVHAPAGFAHVLYGHVRSGVRARFVHRRAGRAGVHQRVIAKD
jgi:hypothetical protein